MPASTGQTSRMIVSLKHLPERFLGTVANRALLPHLGVRRIAIGRHNTDWTRATQRIAIVESTSHEDVLTWPSLSGHTDRRSAALAKFQPQQTSTFVRSMLECFRGRTNELHVLGR